MCGLDLQQYCLRYFHSLFNHFWKHSLRHAFGHTLSHRRSSHAPLLARIAHFMESVVPTQQAGLCTFIDPQVDVTIFQQSSSLSTSSVLASILPTPIPVGPSPAVFGARPNDRPVAFGWYRPHGRRQAEKAANTFTSGQSLLLGVLSVVLTD